MVGFGELFLIVGRRFSNAVIITQHQSKIKMHALPELFQEVANLVLLAAGGAVVANDGKTN